MIIKEFIEKAIEGGWGGDTAQIKDCIGQEFKEWAIKTRKSSSSTLSPGKQLQKLRGGDRDFMSTEARMRQ